MAMNSSICRNFTAEEFRTIHITKLTLSSFSTVLCIAAIIILLVIICKRNGRQRFALRLVLYFLITVLFQAVVLILEQVPIMHNDQKYLVEVRKGWDKVCAIFGFFDQWALWMGNFIVLWIFLYLLYRVLTIYSTGIKYGDSTDLVQPFSKKEFCMLMVVFFFPLLFNWIPFTMDMYGLSGLWCWIKAVKHNCNDDKTPGLVLMFLFFYGPLILIVLFGMVCLLIVVIVVTKLCLRVNGSARDQFKPLLREMALIMAYPILYNLICGLLLTNRIYSAFRTNDGEKPFFPLWLAHSLGDSLRTLIPPLAFLFLPSTWKAFKAPQKVDTTIGEDMDTSEYFYVPAEDKDMGEGFIIKGKPTRYQSIGKQL